MNPPTTDAGRGVRIDKVAGSEEAPRSACRLQLYLLIVVALPFAFLLSSIPIVRSASFPRDSADPFLLNPDYAFSLKHADCDVLVFGDSTALTGIDPTTIERSTGLRTCNIAQSQGILEILGFMALDSYLENNAAPQFIVLQFAPETFSRDGKHFSWEEGFTLLLRKKSVVEALPALARHPVGFYYFALWAIKAKLTALFYPPPDFSAMEAIFQSRRGLLVLPKPPATHCTRTTPYVAPELSWVRMLREKYGRPGTRVIIDISPLPTCAPYVGQIAAATREVTDNALPLFPIGLFSDLDRHLTLEGAERSSLEIARQILTLKRQPAPARIFTPAAGRDAALRRRI